MIFGLTDGHGWAGSEAMSATPEYLARISTLLKELGVPDDYGTSRRLDLQPEATDLVPVARSDEGRECLMTPAAAEAWRTMRARAADLGIELTPLSGFRSVERQAEIIRGKRALGEPLHEILRTIAAPGFSEHHTGRAIDIGTPGVPPLEEAFATTAAYAWLNRHAAHFGFRLSYPRNNVHAFVYEPWHWFWVGWGR